MIPPLTYVAGEVRSVGAFARTDPPGAASTIGTSAATLERTCELMTPAGDPPCQAPRRPDRNARAGAIRSSATRFAVSHLLDRHLGVRWLWPGTLGTYVPKQSTIILPPLDITTRPDLVERSFLVGLPKYSAEAGTSKSVVNRMLQDTGNWWAHHQLGDRGELEFGHAFTRWWEKYHADHPDYFAVPPSGTAQVSTRAVKLCTSNPSVIERIVSEWKAAGMPAVWNVGPNDGIGFCTCARCQSLDLGGPHAAEDVWSGKVNLTARHVAFYNELLRQMRQLASKTMLCSFAYSAYRNPPVGLSIEKGLALEFVHSYTARDEWQGWSAAGVGLALRPNWLASSSSNTTRTTSPGATARTASRRRYPPTWPRAKRESHACCADSRHAARG